MLTTLLWILLGAGGAVLAAGAVCLLAPIRILARCDSVAHELRIDAEAIWLSRAALVVRVSSPGKRFQVLLLGRFDLLSRRHDARPGERPAPESPPGASTPPHPDPANAPPAAESGDGAQASSGIAAPDAAPTQESERDDASPADPKLTKRRHGIFAFAARARARLIRLKASKRFFLLRQTWWHRKALRWAVRSGKRSLRVIAIRRLHAEVAGDLGDPVLTGNVYGIVTGVRHALLTTRKDARVDLRFEPSFNGDELSVHGELRAATSLARLMLPVFLAVLTFPYLSTYLLWRRTRAFTRRQAAPAGEVSS